LSNLAHFFWFDLVRVSAVYILVALTKTKIITINECGFHELKSFKMFLHFVLCASHSTLQVYLLLVVSLQPNMSQALAVKKVILTLTKPV